MIYRKKNLQRKKNCLRKISSNHIFATVIKQALLDLADPKPGMIIADAGCGLGDTTFRLAKYVGNTGKVIGFDNSKLFVENAKKALESQHKDLLDVVSFDVADIFNLGYHNDMFDIIICERVMQHLEKYEDALKQLIRILKPNGRLIIQDPSWKTLLFSGPNEIICQKLSETALHRIQNPNMGMQMPVILNKLGLKEVHLKAAAWHCEKLEDCCAWNPDSILTPTGTLWTPEEGKLWYKEILDANSKGIFFSSLTIFCTVGLK